VRLGGNPLRRPTDRDALRCVHLLPEPLIRAALSKMWLQEVHAAVACTDDRDVIHEVGNSATIPFFDGKVIVELQLVRGQLDVDWIV